MNPVLSRIRQLYDTLITHQGFRRYFLNTWWVFTEKILRLISGLFVGAYVARYLGPGQFGLLNYVISLVSLFSIVATLGLDTLVVRELVRDDSRRANILGVSLSMRLIACLAVLLVLTLFLRLTHADPVTQLLVYVILAGNFFETFGVIDFFFQAKVWSKYSVISQIISVTIVSALRIVLIQQHAPLLWFAMTYSIDLAIAAAGMVGFYFWKTKDFVRLRFDRKLAAGLLRDSWPLIFSSLAVTIYMKIGQLMINWMMGNEASGNYGVAVRLCEAWNFIPIAICASLFPAILNAKQVSEEQYLRRLQRLYELMVFISASIAIPMTFLSGFIVRLLFGGAYDEASGIVVLYIWSSVFIFLGVANGKWIISENLQVFRMVSLCIAGLLNIVLNYILILSMGLKGAAVSSLISYSFASYFSFLLTKRTRPMFVQLTKSLNIFALPTRLLTNKL